MHMTACFDVRPARFDEQRPDAELLCGRQGVQMMTMKRMLLVKLLGITTITALFLVQTNCQLLVSTAAVEGGKKVYEKMKGDDSSNKK